MPPRSSKEAIREPKSRSIHWESRVSKAFVTEGEEREEMIVCKPGGPLSQSAKLPEEKVKSKKVGRPGFTWNGLSTHDSVLVVYGPENIRAPEVKDYGWDQTVWWEEDEKEAFEEWLSFVKKLNMCNLDQMAHICSDEGARRELYERACKITIPKINGFKSTIDTVNRVKDFESVAQKLGLPERGIDDVKRMWLPAINGLSAVIMGHTWSLKNRK